MCVSPSMRQEHHRSPISYPKIRKRQEDKVRKRKKMGNKLRGDHINFLVNMAFNSKFYLISSSKC